MSNVIIIVEALFFLMMGIVAIVKPNFVTGLFGEPKISIDMRNEVRAVYGGFGVAIAAVLVLTMFRADIRDGVLVTVGVSVLGMAAGRMISYLIERPNTNYPSVFTVLECLLGGGLLYVWWSTGL